MVYFNSILYKRIEMKLFMNQLNQLKELVGDNIPIYMLAYTLSNVKNSL